MIRRAALLSLLFSGLASAVSPGEAEAQKCEEKIAAVQRDVLAKYDDALQELQNTFQKSADLEGALAVRDERQRVAAQHVLGESNFAAEPKSLRALQQQTLGRLRDLSAQLAQDTLPKLIEFKKSLTVAGRLDEALAVRVAIDKLQDSYLPIVPADASAAISAETLLASYAADRTRADKTYKGQAIVVRGLVGGFRQDPTDAKTCLVYLTGGAAGGWVQCAFGGDYRWREEKGANKAPLLSLTGKEGDTIRIQKNQTLDIRGVCEGLDEVVKLSKCDLPK